MHLVYIAVHASAVSTRCESENRLQTKMTIEYSTRLVSSVGTKTNQSLEAGETRRNWYKCHKHRKRHTTNMLIADYQESHIIRFDNITLFIIIRYIHE